MRTTRSGPEVLLTDVGFGVSQVLPVVVESFYAEPGSTVIMEQPEIHLHPAVQAGLADLFIEAISSREYGQPPSDPDDHRIPFRAPPPPAAAEDRRGGTVDPSDVACFFVSPGGRNGSSIEPLQVDEYGTCGTGRRTSSATSRAT